MGSDAARNAMLVVLAMAIGLTLGAATKFGLGYGLSAKADAHAAKILARQ
jgi:hypothetical protein